MRRVAALDDVTEAERRGDQRRVVLDVGAHHEDVARLEGRSESSLPRAARAAPRAAPATWRAGPWQRCTWTDRSAGSRRAALRARTASARRSAWSQPSSVSGSAVAARPRASSVGRAEAALQLALVAAERGEQRVPDPAVADVVACAAPGPARSASRCHRSSLGCGSHRCRSWWVASARSSSISVAGIRVWPNSEMRGGRSLGPGAQPLERRRVPLGAGAARPTASARARHSGGCQARSPSRSPPEPVGGVAGGPVDEQLRPLRGVRREQAGQPARDGVAAAPPELRLVAGVAVPEVAAPGWPPTARRGSRRAPTAAARPARRAPTGRRRGCRSARRSASAGTGTRRPRTPRHRRPRPTCRAGGRAAGSATAPRPRAGTSTSSVANGSSSGVDSSSPRASASRSVRGARWRWSTTARPYGRPDAPSVTGRPRVSRPRTPCGRRRTWRPPRPRRWPRGCRGTSGSSTPAARPRGAAETNWEMLVALPPGSHQRSATGHQLGRLRADEPQHAGRRDEHDHRRRSR